MLQSIQIRIVAAFLAALTTTLSALLFLAVQYNGVAQSQSLITEGYLPLALMVDLLRDDQSRVETDVNRLLGEKHRPVAGDGSATAIYTSRLRENLLEARVHATQALQMAQDPREVAVLNKVQSQLAKAEDVLKQYQHLAKQLVETAELGDLDSARDLEGPLRRDGRALAEELDKLDKLIDGRIESLSLETENRRARATAIAFGLTVLAALISLVLIVAVLLALRPINRLTEQVQRLAAGDYTGRVEVAGNDEIAALAVEFNKMVEALAVRDRALVERAEELNRLSGYLTSVVDGLEEGLVVVENDEITLANPVMKRDWDAAVGSELSPALSALQPGLTEVEHEGRAFAVRISPFGDNGAVIVVSDVTERKVAAERLERSERLAIIGQMLAQITHEVRNPLNALSLNAEMLADELGGLDPTRKTEAWDLLDTVSGEIGRLTEVTGHYLQLARRPRAQLAPTNLVLLVEDVVRLLAAELDQQGVELRTELEPMAEQLVDGNQMRQSLLNVVRNAVEAGAQHLVLQLEQQGSEVLIGLSDDGPGMAEEEARRAFDPFFSSKASGTGLGLAITRQILEDHDGSVRVESALGEGTRVTLVLPAGRVQGVA